jgi:prolipoprotein diacylglyceryl transferase
VSTLHALFASIPSPGSDAIHIGKLQLRAYGLMIALGVIAAVWLTGKRLEREGIGTTDDISAIALWAVPAGVIGARIYHVITDYQQFEGDWGRVFKIWEGGLGIWGGVALGVPVGLWAAHRRGLPIAGTLTAATPALPLAQAIGRWGNWWNQELFGRPTTLPWALRISADKIPAGYPPGTTFHPTFLYESLWNLALCGGLIMLDRRVRLRPGRLFVYYVAGYTFARYFIESLRIDTAHKIAGQRVNEWVAALVFGLAIGYLVVDARLHRGEPVPADEPRRAPSPFVDDADAADAVGVVEEPVADAEVDDPADGDGEWIPDDGVLGGRGPARARFRDEVDPLD